MIAFNDVKQISSKLSMEIIGMESDDLSEDISCIVYRTDMFEVGDDAMIDRHIDIEYSFGEYYEVCEDTSLFQYIIHCVICHYCRRSRRLFSTKRILLTIQIEIDSTFEETE